MYLCCHPSLNLHFTPVHTLQTWLKLSKLSLCFLSAPFFQNISLFFFPLSAPSFYLLSSPFLLNAWPFPFLLFTIFPPFLLCYPYPVPLLPTLFPVCPPTSCLHYLGYVSFAGGSGKLVVKGHFSFMFTLLPPCPTTPFCLLTHLCFWAFDFCMLCRMHSRKIVYNKHHVKRSYNEAVLKYSSVLVVNAPLHVLFI